MNKIIGAEGKQQKVYESTTQSGIRGLFTAGRLAWSLKDGEDAEAVALRVGFAFAPKETA